MEPNTSISPAAKTLSPVAVLKHGEPYDVHDDLSLLSPIFSPARSPSLLPASGSGSESSRYQEIPPSLAMAEGNGSLSIDVHLASLSESMPSSSFPIADKLPMVGYDLFGYPEGTAATPLPMVHGGHWGQGESASVVVPESSGLFGFAGESAAWPSKETSSFFSPSSDCELEALQQSMHIPSLVVEESPVDAAMSTIEEEEDEIDVSAFLVSDPENQLPNTSWAVGPQMASSGGRASASWMVPVSNGSNGSPMSAPAQATTCTMVSTNRGSMACSIRGMMKPSSRVLPLVPPSTQDAGASSTNFNSFAQPSLSSVLAPHAPNLQGPLLPVKHEVMEYVDARARLHPDFISLVDEEEDGLYQDAIFGSWGSSNSSWSGSSGGSSSFAHGSWGGGCSSSPSFAPGSWDSSSSGPSYDGSMPCFDQSTSIDNYGSSSMQTKLSIRGKMASISGLPPLPESCVRTSCSNGGNGLVFTDPEMAIISKERKLQELLRTDPKKVKRILYNRAYSAAAKVRKVMHTKNLERQIVTLEERRKSLCEELQSLQEGFAALRAQQMEMQMIIGELEQQTMLKDAVREGLRADIQNLKHLKLN